MSAAAPYRTKAWWALLAAVSLYFLASTSVIIGVYSEQMKANLSISQEQLTAITSLGFVGYLVPVGGWLCYKVGVRACIASGGFLMSLGYIFIYLSTKDVLPKDVAFVGVCYSLSMQGQYWFLVAGAELITKNFPLRLGLAAGILECAFGIGAGLFTVMFAGYLSISEEDVPAFMFMGVSAAVLSVAAVLGATNSPTTSSSNRAFNYLTILLGCMMVVLLISAFEQSADRVVYSVIVTVLLLMMAVAPFLMLVVKEEDGGEEAANSSPSEAAAAPTMQELSIREGFQSLDLYLAFWSIAVPNALCYSVAQFIGQTVLATHAKDVSSDTVASDTTSVETVASVCAGVSAILSGHVADYFLTTIPRPYWLAVASVFLAIGSASFFLTSLSLANVYVGFGFYMFGFSTIWANFPGVVTELFGNTNSAIFFGFQVMGFSVIQVFTNYILAVKVYESNTLDTDDGVCYGSACYRATFIVYMCLALSSAGTAAWLGARSKKFYNSLGVAAGEMEDKSKA